MNAIKKLVSIITPTYESAATLPNCISSVRNQTYNHWEHIIIDDGSTDETWKILKKLSKEDSRLRVLRQSNSGQAKARKKGISLAHGDYIAFLDADDLSMPSRLAMQVEFMNNHPEVDVLGGGIINISYSGENLGKSFLSPDHETLVANVYRRCPFYTSTVMARPQYFLETGGFDVTLRRAEDYDLWLRGYKQFRYYNLQEPLVYYRRDTIPNWWNVVYTSRVILRAIAREKNSPFYLWYAARPLLSFFLRKIGLK